MTSLRSALPTSHALIAAAIAIGPFGSAAAAPVSLNGATFEAPAACVSADGALVCKVDNQQFELWVNRKPLAPNVEPSDPMAKKMAYFTEVHEAAVGNIMRTTNNEAATQFSNYGTYSAMGSALPGKGVPTSPAVRFASVLHNEEIWEFMEVVAARSATIEALSKSLQASLKLPAAKPVAAATPTDKTAPAAAKAAPVASTPSDSSVIVPPAPDATFKSQLLTLQYPTFLEPIVVEDTATALSVKFRHTSRAAGPHLTLVVRATVDKLGAGVVAAQRKAAIEAAMVGKSASVPVTKLASINGAGFALLGVPDPAKGLSGVETIETLFVGDVDGRQLEARVTSEQKFSGEAQAVWGLMSKSLQLR